MKIYTLNKKEILKVVDYYGLGKLKSFKLFSHGLINFNYKIIFLTPQEQDYLIIHELCHLQEMNHSSAFWSLVQKQTPRLRL